jgi:hypothetical protein
MENSMDTAFFRNVLLAMFILFSVGQALGQSSDDRDFATGIAMTMMVDRVEAGSGTVILDGKAYVVSGQSNALRAAESPSGTRALSLRELRPGMEVVVMTDGTVPEGNHKPQIRGIWLAP